MPFPAHVVQVLVASPGDVAEERAALRRAMWEWNDEHAAALGVVLLPVGWETHSRPELGDHPQHLIDRQLAESADVLIGVFWTRLGTRTPDAASGTVHEIESFAEAGKPVLLYFSDRPAVPTSVDLDQLAAVQAFRQTAEGWGLIGRFDDVDSLVRQARTALLRLVRDRFDLPTAIAPTGAGSGRPRVMASIATEREQKSVDAKGQYKYTTRRFLVLTNAGDATARSVTVSWVEGQEGPRIYGAEEPIDYLARGTDVRFSLLTSYGDSGSGTLHLTWQDEDGREYEERQTVRM
ncbi:hypothetical protein [Modestobacter sp. SYSU DS0290]